MIELYNGDCRTFLSNYNGAQFDAVITDPPYASGGATLAAAELEGYDSVGVELSEEIAKSAAQRLSVPLKKVGD